jgi:hypothetical protein
MFRVCTLREYNARFLSLNNSRGPAIRVNVFSGSIFGGGHSLEEIGVRPRKFSADSKRFGSEMTSEQGIGGNRSQLGRESNAFRTRCHEAVGLLKFPALREIYSSLCRNKKKTRLCVKKCGIFRGITIARL